MNLGVRAVSDGRGVLADAGLEADGAGLGKKGGADRRRQVFHARAALAHVRELTSALPRDRLSWVSQNYIRGETLRRANARLDDYQSMISLARQWGGGEVASADGLRFVVQVRTINAGPNAKYFGVGRGITYFNFTSDQFTGFHSIVIPGMLRDSTFILEGLLEHETALRPSQVMSDTAGYSDLVF